MEEKVDSLLSRLIDVVGSILERLKDLSKPKHDGLPLVFNPIEFSDTRVVFKGLPSAKPYRWVLMGRRTGLQIWTITMGLNNEIRQFKVYSPTLANHHTNAADPNYWRIELPGRMSDLIIESLAITKDTDFDLILVAHPL